MARACGERLHGILVEEGESSSEELEGLSEYNWERVMEACFGKMDEEVVGVGGGGVGRTVGIVGLSCLVVVWLWPCLVIIRYGSFLNI